MPKSKTKILIIGSASDAQLAQMAQALQSHKQFDFVRHELQPLKLWARAKQKLWHDLLGSSNNLFLKKRLAKPRLPEVLSALRSDQPALVVVSDLESAAAMALIKSRRLYFGKLIVMLNGFDFDPNLLFEQADYYLCSSIKQQELLARSGIAPDKIFVIHPSLPVEFSQPQDKQQALGELNLLTTMPVVLVILNDARAKLTRETLLKLVRSTTAFQIAVLCLDPNLKLELERITTPVRHPVKIFTDLSKLGSLLGVSSAVLGPIAGSLLVQCAALQVPIIVTDLEIIPDLSSIQYLASKQAVAIGRIPAESAFLAESVLEGKRITQVKIAYEVLVDPPHSVDLGEFLGKINIPQPIIKNN